MKIFVSSPPMADDTAYGFELRYLDFARMLMKEGITPHELKEHYHDFQWCVEIVKKDFDKAFEKAARRIVEDSLMYEKYEAALLGGEE